MRSLGELALVFRLLSAHSEYADAERLELAVVVAKGARLRGAAGDIIPAGNRRLVRSPRAWIEEEHGPAATRCLGEVDCCAKRRGKRDHRHLQAGEVLARAVIDGDRQIRR